VMLFVPLGSPLLLGGCEWRGPPLRISLDNSHRTSTRNKNKQTNKQTTEHDLDLRWPAAVQEELHVVRTLASCVQPHTTCKGRGPVTRESSKLFSFRAEGCSVLAHLPPFLHNCVREREKPSLKFLSCEHNPVHVPTAIPAWSCCFTHLREQIRRPWIAQIFGRAQERRWSGWHLVGFLQVCEKFKRLEIKKMEF
jgi:hypothetical protein